MVFAHSLKACIKDIGFDGHLDYKTDNLRFVEVMQNADFEFVYSTGKDRHPLMVVRDGNIKSRFMETNETITITKGKLLFIPKNYPYVAKYLENNTIIKILIFDTDSSSKFLTATVLKNPNDHSASFYDERTRSTSYLDARVYDFLDILEKDKKLYRKSIRKYFRLLKNST